MKGSEQLLKRLPNDIGGLDAGPVERVDHELEPWEKRCHALADVLDFHKIINTEEKRRGVEALGAEMIGRLTTTSGGSLPSPTSSFRRGSSRPATSRARWMRSRHDTPWMRRR